MHKITTRTPTADEQRFNGHRSKPDIASYGCLTIFFGLLPAFGLGKIGGWLGGLISPEASTYGQWFGWSIAAVIFVSALVSFFRYELGVRRRASKDYRSLVVQDIHVTNPNVVEIGLISDNEPILAFDIGENKILYLQGQWLRDENTYGAEPLEGDPYEEFINGLPAPHSFPSTEFTVSRFPNSGKIVAIRVTGNYLAPKATVEALKPEFEFGDSELLEGSLGDIAGVLEREHERRATKSS